MQQRHLFILDPLESLNMKLDSSLRMAFELQKRGHDIFVCETRHLTWRTPNSFATAQSQELIFGEQLEKFTLSPHPESELAAFSAIHMRKDPPFDLDYITATWILDTVADLRPVFNHPRALRSLNEKLAILRYPDACAAALVSSDPKELHHFLMNAAAGDAVVKPLHLFGGRGVIRIQARTANSEQQALAELMRETNQGQHLRIIQKFAPEVFDGEVRAFCVGGESLAWCLKKPAAGEFLANTRAGAVLLPYEPTKTERILVNRIAKDLFAEGIFFVGFDLIGGKLSEINLTSPRLLQGEGDRSNPYAAIAEKIEVHVEKLHT